MIKEIRATRTAGKTYFVGLDLAQVSDYSAVAVIEAEERWDIASETLTAPTFALRHLHRWPRGTKYPAIVSDVGKLVSTTPLALPTLVVDVTGVGRPVFDMLRDADVPARLRAVLITAGHQVTRDEIGSWRVPKKELVAVMQVLLQSGRLLIGRVPERETLVQELLAFRVKITAAANETFESWRERDHDDLVLAVALAAWAAERESGGRGAMPFALEHRDARQGIYDPGPRWPRV